VHLEPGQYFRLEIRLASHSLNRSHRVCIGAPGMTLTVHLAVSNMEDSPNDHSPAFWGRTPGLEATRDVARATSASQSRFRLLIQ
jgi:hypothetical protein